MYRGEGQHQRILESSSEGEMRLEERDEEEADSSSFSSSSEDEDEEMYGRLFDNALVVRRRFPAPMEAPDASSMTSDDWNNIMQREADKRARLLDPVRALHLRQVAHPRSNTSLLNHACLAVPAAMQEVMFEEQARFNKVFASCWVGPDTVLTGSKDNKLALWDVSNPHAVQLERVEMPRRHKSPLPQEMTGIHDVSVTPNGKLLASGAHNPNEIVVFETETWRPVVQLWGHRDWVFGMAFVDDTHLLSASRDCSIALWNVNTGDSDGYATPGVVREEHSDKVRALALDSRTNNLATLSADRSVIVWDVDSMDVVSRMRTIAQRDLVVLEADETRGLFAAGGMRFISFVDPRTKKMVRSLDRSSGVDAEGTRSISFTPTHMTLGGAQGSLMFYDFAADKICQELTIHTSPGRFLVDAAQHRFWADQVPQNQAIYTQSWDAHSARLFVGGGPLLLGIDGSYSALYV